MEETNLETKQNKTKQNKNNQLKTTINQPLITGHRVLSLISSKRQPNPTDHLLKRLNEGECFFSINLPLFIARENPGFFFIPPFEKHNIKRIFS